MAELRPLCQEIEHGGFKTRTPDRQHVVAARYAERLRARDQRGERFGRPRDLVLATDCNEQRRRNAADLGTAERLARAAHAGGERRQIRLGLLGEGTKQVSGRVGHVGNRRRLQPLGDRLRQADALYETNAKSAQYRRAYAIGMRQGKERRDTCAHRITDDVRTRQRKMIKERPNVLRHDRAVIGSGIIKFAGSAVAAVVERDGAIAGARQRRDPGRRYPVYFLVRGEPVHQYDRLALAFVKEGDFYVVMCEAGHFGPYDRTGHIGIEVGTYYPQTLMLWPPI